MYLDFRKIDGKSILTSNFAAHYLTWQLKSLILVVLDGMTIKWIHSFLANHTRMPIYGMIQIELESYGVPKGSVLGLLLFNISVIIQRKKGMFIKTANDTRLGRTASTIEHRNKIQINFNILNELGENKIGGKSIISFYLFRKQMHMWEWVSWPL